MKRFFLLALLQTALYLLLLYLAPQVEKNVGLLPQFLGIWSVLFLFYYAGLIGLHKRSAEFSPQLQKNLLYFVLATGLLFRLIAFFFPLMLSHDLYYYMWYGRLQTYGLNPYLYTVNAPELTYLRDPVIWANVSFKQIVPVYPAFIMKIFHLAYLVGGDSVLGFKLLQFLPETVTCLAGIALLKAYGKNPLWIMVYAWCPLPVVEYLGMGHSDTWAIAMLTLFLYFYKRSRLAASAVALACGTLVKWIPILWIPLVIKNLSWRDRLKWGGYFVATFALLYLPFYSAKEQMLGLLPNFVQSYEFNGSVYQVLREFLGRADWAHQTANVLIGMGTLFIVSRRLEWSRALTAVFLVFFIFSYQIFPWYLGYFLPLLLLTSVWGIWVWLLTCIFSYQVLMPFLWTGTWVESPYILVAQYLPFYLGLLAQWIYTKRKVFKDKASVSLPSGPALPLLQESEPL